MSTPAEKIKYLNETKIAIKEAIVAKGVEVSEDATFRSYADSIAAIETGAALPEQEKSLEIIENGEYEVTPDEGYVLSKVTAVVAIDIPEPVIESLEIVENGTYTAPAGVDGYSPIVVNVPTGGGGDSGLPEEIVFSGDCSSLFINGSWDWAVELAGDRMRTKDITNSQYMFRYSNITKIPFDLNFKPNTAVNLANSFDSCYYLTTIPKINNCRPSNIERLFSHCRHLRYIPEDIENWFDWSSIENATSTYSGGRNNTFQCCYSLRSVPSMGFLNHHNKNIKSGNSYSLYNYGFNNCYVLDEVVGLPVETFNSPQTSNMFNFTFDRCARLKNMTFAVQEDGSPYVADWKSQSISLTASASYSDKRDIFDYNSGITADKEVKDDATYQALKNDPDWFTSNEAYARYNHDSAVATINSLPDTSAYLATAGGTNTIKFMGAAGSKTDGGAINTLTAEEIAVATAKGWTITFV